jgi:hypothetical protein
METVRAGWNAYDQAVNKAWFGTWNYFNAFAERDPAQLPSPATAHLPLVANPTIWATCLMSYIVIVSAGVLHLSAKERRQKGKPVVAPIATLCLVMLWPI